MHYVAHIVCIGNNKSLGIAVNNFYRSDSTALNIHLIVAHGLLLWNNSTEIYF